MALAAGTRIGAYEILSPIGAGGMGEVYRARDTKLKRDVAIKVLPEAFANDEQRMKRFAREAAEDVSLTLAEVMKSEPRWDALPSDVSPTLRAYLERCLKKDAKERVRDIGDVRLALDGAFEVAAPPSEPTATKPRTLAWVAAAVIATGLAVWALTRPDPPRVARVMVAASNLRIGPVGRDLAISSDGQWLVYRGVGRALYIRGIDRFETIRLDVDEDGSSPFISPDGAWIGFASMGALQKVPVRGGNATKICEIPEFRGASWGDDDTIVFAAARRGLFRVAAAGEEPRQLTEPEGVSHLWPEVLPGGKAILFVIERGVRKFDVAVLSLETGEHRLLVEGGTSPRFLSTGHIMFVRDGALMVVPFDVERLQVTGDTVSALPGVFPKFNGATNYDVSNDGVLIYLPGHPQSGSRRLVWVDRQGREELLDFEPRGYNAVALSAEGNRVATSVEEDIWIHDVPRGASTRLTFDGASNIFPLWSSDGERVVFRRQGTELSSKSADGAGSEQRLADVDMFPFSMSPDGGTLVGGIWQEEILWDIAKASLEGSATVVPLVFDPSNQWHPQISPSGKWLAYYSRGSGRTEVYIRPYPDVDTNRWQVSTKGGVAPVWSPREDELFYRNGNQMLAVPVAVGNGIEIGTPALLFEGNYYSDTSMKHYDVSPDGQRFLMIKDGESASNTIHVVLNWFHELRNLQ